MVRITTEDSLFRLASRLRKAPSQRSAGALKTFIERSVAEGEDLLGEVYGRVVSPERRRLHGATFTPSGVVRVMVEWAKAQNVKFERIVDPGAGSGRFVLAAARAFPDARLVAIENNERIARLLQANIAAAGIVDRVSVIVEDYRAVQLPRVTGRTLFIGNPPYVRHHEIDPRWKGWYVETLRSYGLPGSSLAGLHLHFLLRTYQLASPGDYGCFITAAEWLDVNYGAAARAMLTNGMGGLSLHIIDKSAHVFQDALTSSVILCFEAGSQSPSLQVRHVGSVDGLGPLHGGTPVSRSAAVLAEKWSQLTGAVTRCGDAIELGELFDVHRGQVTGMNRVWVASEHGAGLPTRVLVPTVTRAREIIQTLGLGNRLGWNTPLRKVIDLPADLTQFSTSERRDVDKFLQWARSRGAHETYIARHRRPWWHVNLRAPAPIVMTYMARRPPVFALNLCGARIINIAHGLYPLIPLTEDDLSLIVRWLNGNTGLTGGRMYAGGLTKFEPREVMRLRMPRLETLRAMEPL